MSQELDPNVHLNLSMTALGIGKQEVTGAKVDERGQLVVQWQRGSVRETNICFGTTARAKVAHQALARRCNFS